MKKVNKTTAKYWKSKVQAGDGLHLTRKQFDRIAALPGCPGKDQQGYHIEAWTAFVSAVGDPNNELKRLRAELLRVQIERLRGNLIERKLFIEQTERREVALVQIVELWRQNKLGRMRDPDDAAKIDGIADSFRAAMKDALEQERIDLDKRIGDAGGGNMEFATEDSDLEMGAE
jgi:hypothetical protein